MVSFLGFFSFFDLFLDTIVVAFFGILEGDDVFCFYLLLASLFLELGSLNFFCGFIKALVCFSEGLF